LDKLELIDDIDTWVELRKIRNSLAHEYEDEINQFIIDNSLLMVDA